MKSTELYAILDTLSQPVFIAQNGTISYTNPVMEQLDHKRGASVYPLLGVHLAEYRAFTGDGVLSLPVTVGQQTFRASIQRSDPGDLFVLAPMQEAAPDEDSLRLDTFGDIAQQLRTPISSLLAATSVLFPYLEESEAPKLRSHMAYLNKTCYQLLRTAGNLSDAKALLNGSAKLSLESVDLTRHFSDFAERIQSLCEVSGIDFTAKLPSGSCACMIDPKWIERAVLNLISNALKYTPQGGSIRMVLELGESTAYLRISDSGEGMDAAALASAFDRYEHPASLDPREGLGLGLPITRAIAALHGGTLVLNSRPGSGTTAVLSFNLRADTPLVLSTSVSHYNGFDRMLVELADVLPDEIFDSENVN
jgi:signal transduction histidine kinase